MAEDWTQGFVDTLTRTVTAALADEITPPSPAAGRPRNAAWAEAVLNLARAPHRPRNVAAGGGRTVVALRGVIGYDVLVEDFLGELATVTAGDVIELRVNSPGGDVWSGLEIFNALRDHPARVESTVDGLAASAASWIILAGDQVVMNRGSELMIHDALTVTVGDEAEHLRTAEMLGRTSDTIAKIYARRAGGTVEKWRQAMRTETWYSASEAVAAGLADRAVEDEEDAELAAAVRNAVHKAFA